MNSWAYLPAVAILQLLISSYTTLTGAFDILCCAFHCRRDLLDRHSRRCYSESNAWWQAYWEHYSGWPADSRWYCCRLNRKKGISESVLICVNIFGFICGQNNGLPLLYFLNTNIYIYLYTHKHTHTHTHTHTESHPDIEPLCVHRSGSESKYCTTASFCSQTSTGAKKGWHYKGVCYIGGLTVCV